MSADRTRRPLLRRALLLTLGAVGLDGIAQRAYGALRQPARQQPSREYRSGAVEAVRGQHVRVVGSHEWLPFECVPDGWRIQVGDAVLVGPSPLLGRVSAQQLVRWITVRVRPSDLEVARRIGGASGPMITELTAFAPDLNSFRQSGQMQSKRVRVAVASRKEPDGRERVLAVRSERL